MEDRHAYFTVFFVVVYFKFYSRSYPVDIDYYKVKNSFSSICNINMQQSVISILHKASKEGESCVSADCNLFSLKRLSVLYASPCFHLNFLVVYLPIYERHNGPEPIRPNWQLLLCQNR